MYFVQSSSHTHTHRHIDNISGNYIEKPRGRKKPSQFVRKLSKHDTANQNGCVKEG